MKSLGIVTIGQSPRRDMMPEMVPLLGNVQIYERGALDDCDLEAVSRLTPMSGDETLTTRMRSGEAVVIGKASIVPMVQRCIDDLEHDGVSGTLVVCTGKFPTLRHTMPLFLASHLITHGVCGLVQDEKLGVICPLPEQCEDSERKFSSCIVSAVSSSSPYTDGKERLAQAAHDVAMSGAQIIVLDCMGYTEVHRSIVAKATGLPVLLSRTIVARLVAEIGGDPRD